MSGYPSHAAGNQSPCESADNFPRAIYLTLILVTLCLRMIGLMVRQEYIVPPMVGGDAGIIARQLANGQAYPAAAHLPPAYPFLLAGLMKLGMSSSRLYFTAVALNVMFAMLLPAIVLGIGQTAGFPPFVSLLAALGMLFCPEAFRAPGHVTDEAIFTTLAAALLLWTLVCLQPTKKMPGLWHAVSLALASGALAWLNPALILVTPLTWMLALRIKGLSWKPVLAHGTLFAVITALAVLPWLLRSGLPAWPISNASPGGILLHLRDQFDAFWLGIAEARQWGQNPWLLFVTQGLPALFGMVGLFMARRQIPAHVLAVSCMLLLVFPLPYYIAGADAQHRHPIDFVLSIGCAWLVWRVLNRHPDKLAKA